MTRYEILLQNHNILMSVQNLIQRNENISAIKLVKDKTGLSLKESKDVVDHIGKSPFTTEKTFENTAGFSEDEILHKNNAWEEIHILLQQNKELEAIKLAVNNTGMSLQDAKNFVKSIQKKETIFNQETTEGFSNIGVTMTNTNGKITVKMKEGNRPDKIVYPNDPDWEKAKKMLGNKPELLYYETEFLNGKHPISDKKSNLFIEENSFGKWVLFLILFCVVMLLIYFYSSTN